ncbi:MULTISPECIES: hypothetical protein [Microbacterium]|uniref:Major facilitator superfamily (MFS) profile domain-containing protein n=1 Tax=Microbacterium wangchenii TaxID=2541726 RepID=A0ABX5SY03_9MICO|nr:MULTISPECIES: hypothetical protein [Microbacterium]MCK6067365.1 hypothetical protein [Microbacterium sp. EYE_512]QBR89694.1 hypothetical protein E4K62_14010 [Microbacterium wangchenii]TFV81043.1 hypothetical protein E4V99_18290 [Microbacterium sp. dk485]TXK16708.1 hypothetical protein FVP99_08505 [Microbacterium wangchenii]
MTAPANPRRPVVIWIAVALVYVSALGNVAVGVLVLLSRYRVRADAVLAVSLLGSAIILTGLLLLAVASGLALGSRLSRGLSTGYLGVLVALNATTLVATDPWDGVVVAQVVVQSLVALAVWVPPGSRVFAAAQP